MVAGSAAHGRAVFLKAAAAAGVPAQGGPRGEPGARALPENPSLPPAGPRRVLPRPGQQLTFKGPGPHLPLAADWCRQARGNSGFP